MAQSREFGYYAEAEDYYTEPVEPEPKYICDGCECGIYEGDRVWSFAKYHYCEECAEGNFSKLA